MSPNPDSLASEEMQDSNQYKAIEECMDEIGLRSPELAERYPLSVIATAIAEEVGKALLLLQHRGSVTSSDVKKILMRIEKMAFGNCDKEP